MGAIVGDVRIGAARGHVLLKQRFRLCGLTVLQMADGQHQPRVVCLLATFQRTFKTDFSLFYISKRHGAHAARIAAAGKGAGGKVFHGLRIAAQEHVARAAHIEQAVVFAVYFDGKIIIQTRVFIVARFQIEIGDLRIERIVPRQRRVGAQGRGRAARVARIQTELVGKLLELRVFTVQRRGFSRCLCRAGRVAIQGTHAAQLHAQRRAFRFGGSRVRSDAGLQPLLRVGEIPLGDGDAGAAVLPGGAVRIAELRAQPIADPVQPTVGQAFHRLGQIGVGRRTGVALASAAKARLIGYDGSGEHRHHQHAGNDAAYPPRTLRSRHARIPTPPFSCPFPS